MKHPCEIAGCNRDTHARGWCRLHYQRWKDKGDVLWEPPTPPSMRERIERGISKTASGCWEWQGSISSSGYGRLSKNNRPAYSHRESYEAFVGPIPEGFQIDHLCRNTKCCNPEHLEAVTPLTNGMRSKSFAARKARQTHCIHGHPLSGDNLYIRPKEGWRMCKTCTRLRQTRYASQQKVATL